MQADSIDVFGRKVADVLAGEHATASLSDKKFYFDGLPSRLSPQLSYGRHRGPARLDARRAAVIIVVYPQRSTGQMCLTLTRRPMTLSHHGGQICLPGGQIERGESATEAALREYSEELGVPVAVDRELGRLSPIYVFASDNLVETIVVTAKSPSGQWQPDPVEVDEVIEMPIESLLGLGQLSPPKQDESGMDRDSLSISERKKSRIGKGVNGVEVFQYRFGHPVIEFVDSDGRHRELWGATALLIDAFAGVLSRALEES